MSRVLMLLLSFLAAAPAAAQVLDVGADEIARKAIEYVKKNAAPGQRCVHYDTTGLGDSSSTRTVLCVTDDDRLHVTVPVTVRRLHTAGVSYRCDFSYFTAKPTQRIEHIYECLESRRDGKTEEESAQALIEETWKELETWLNMRGI